MTPFDPVPLLAMLLAFYPLVTPTELARARRERPDYFAGGTLFGSKGDKLRLGDGRVWDLIEAAGGPIAGRRWIAIDVTNDPGAAADPFALEEGPLTPLDEVIVIGPADVGSFEALVADHLAAFDGADDLLSRAGQDAIEFSGAAELEDSYTRDVEPAIEAHEEIRAALDLDDPVDVIDATNNHDREIDAARGDYVEPPVPDTPEPDPGDAPKNHGDDGEPGPPPI